MKELFKDDSVFQGWREFLTPDGWFRAERISYGYKIYKKEDGENCFIFDGVIECRKKNISCEEIYNLYTEEQ